MTVHNIISAVLVGYVVDVDTYGNSSMTHREVYLLENDVVIGKRLDNANCWDIYRCNIGILPVWLHTHPVEQSQLFGSKGILLHRLATILSHLVEM